MLLELLKKDSQMTGFYAIIASLNFVCIVLNKAIWHGKTTLYVCPLITDEIDN